MSSLLGCLALSVYVVGCGGDGGDKGAGNGSQSASCGAPDCGGNLAGRWKIVAPCYDAAALGQTFLQIFLGGSPAMCPQATSSDIRLTTTGELNFDSAALTYDITVSLSLSTTLNIPASCLGGGTCASRNSTTAAAAIACTGTTNCVCVFTGAATNADMGTYTTSGTTAVTTSMNGTVDITPYCVKGTTLVARDMDMVDAPFTALIAEKQ